MNRLEFHISYICVNTCSFCSEHDRMEEFKKSPVSLAEIKKVLVAKRKDGFDFVNFTGGEPTIHPDFPEIAAYAKKLGYRIYVGTNGCMFAKKEFCKHVAPFLDEISFSIHGHTASLHDALVGRKGAFHDIIAAVENISALGCKHIFANVVTVRDNFESAGDILDFLGERGFSQVLFSHLAPEGMGLARYKDLAVRIDAWRRKVPELAAIAEKYGMIVRFFGLPLCALGEYAHLSNDLFWDERTTVERTRTAGAPALVDVPGDAPDRNRVKTDRCAACTRGSMCFGVFDAYVKHFGDKELKPFCDGK